MSSKNTAPENTVNNNKGQKKRDFPWQTVISWSATFLLVVFLVLVLFDKVKITHDTDIVEVTAQPVDFALPEIQNSNTSGVALLDRKTEPNTVFPEGSRQTILKYTVEAGDSIFSIASKYGLLPQSILWANPDYFGGDPTVTLSVGVQLIIPPTDGVLYTWKDGDTLEKVADKYDSTELKIISWPSNNLDVTNPVVSPGAMVMIPDGTSTIRSWIQEVEYTPRSGVTQKIEGEGGCEITGGYGQVGTGGFIWPSANHYLSGWDFASYHKGIDIAALTGDPIWASDSGTVIYAGWNTSGYGYMVMIDHNNGYQTLYAHLSAITVYCGQNITQGTGIGLAGESGNAFGAHLHFEVRNNGSFVNPWYVLN